MERNFLGRGWPFPMRPGERGRLALAGGEEKIRQSLWLILSTAPGERQMRPAFGCGIHDLVFEAIDSTAIQRICSEVEETMRRCEARIDVLGVTVEEAPNEDGKLLIELEYRVRKTNQTGNLVFPFYFREGGRP
jgi:Bacteriophage baseplate protein W